MSQMDVMFLRFGPKLRVRGTLSHIRFLICEYLLGFRQSTQNRSFYFPCRFFESQKIETKNNKPFYEKISNISFFRKNRKICDIIGTSR